MQYAVLTPNPKVYVFPQVKASLCPLATQVDHELHQSIQTGGQFNDTCPRSSGLAVTTRKHGWVINLMTNHLRSSLYHRHQC
jgi:hypothetical protein